MKRFFIATAFICSLVLGTLSMGGCNTFNGMAQDTRETIDAFSVGPNDAYHQDARDF